MLRNRWTRYGIIVFVTALMVGGALSWWAASEIASPSRRILQDYHEEFLAHPQQHDVSLTWFHLSDGTPCLVAEPIAQPIVGKRGSRIRQQLQAESVTLARQGEIIGTLVLVHGRRGRKEDYLLIAERFTAVGFRCIIPDMPGHGEHPEAMTRYGVLEADLPALALREASARLGFHAQPAGLMGISMGGSVSVHAAAQDPSLWGALVIVSSFDALQPVILQQASARVGPWLGGLWADTAAALYESRTGTALSAIQPAAKAATLTMPTLIAHGTIDRVVPIAAGRRLYDALPEALEKRWVEIPRADHDNVLVTDFPIYATIAKWFLQYLRTRP